ncbi:MAG: hypothetical protein Q8P49_01160 [Candidatus Liptonbacteria bacterium]|nr:hypothetical protein [Candidatus Liptonbacteria bacterium]
MIITLTGASGAGKTSIARKLIELIPELKLVLSLTTRDPKPSDLPGEYRSNVPMGEFESRKDEFLWVTKIVHGNRYGTLKSDVDSALASPQPHIMILVPECVGLLRDYIKNKDAVVHFYLLSPSEDELRRRLQGRGDDEAAVEKRIAECKKWDEAAPHSGIPYYFLWNDKPGATGIEKAAGSALAHMRLMLLAGQAGK